MSEQPTPIIEILASDTPPAETSPDVPVVAKANRDNNFNFLRIVLATLVIFSHSPELVDGNRHREPLTRLFGTISFGELAVGGFFLLSGYLIQQSWQRDPKLLDFVKKRVARIYPGFLVATFLCALVVGPLGSHAASYFAQFRWLFFLKNALQLHSPEIPPVFQGTHYAVVDAPMWTILYEFRCYIFVALLGICGLGKQKWVWFVVSGAALALSYFPVITDHIRPHAIQVLFSNLQLLAFFCAGACFYNLRDRIRYEKRWAALAAILLIPCLFWIGTAQLGLMIFGGYLLFWFGFSEFRPLDRFKKWSDISYGVYLYGWPLQKLLLWYIPSLSPWVLFLLAGSLSFLCGLLSWQLVERPILRLARK